MNDEKKEVFLKAAYKCVILLRALVIIGATALVAIKGSSGKDAIGRLIEQSYYDNRV